MHEYKPLSTNRQKQRYTFRSRTQISSHNLAQITQTSYNHSYKGEMFSKYVVPIIIFTTCCGCSSSRRVLIITDVGEKNPKYLWFTHRNSVCVYVCVLLMHLCVVREDGRIIMLCFLSKLWNTSSSHTLFISPHLLFYSNPLICFDISSHRIPSLD